MLIKTLSQLKKMPFKKADITLKIATRNSGDGLTLITLLSALAYLRHHPHLTLVSLTADHPADYEFTQAMFQATYLFPDLSGS
jgi:hypothetical protein